MLRLVFSAVLGLLISHSYGQLKKFYTLRETSRFDTIDFTLRAAAGNCMMHAGDGEGPLVIYGNPDLDKVNPSFKSEVHGGKCKVDLTLQEFKSSGFGDGLIFAMLQSGDQDNFWKVLFDRTKIYRLNLSYGFGDADIDLSGTAVRNLRVKSGSADILVDYEENRPNKVRMDTFWIKSDMGSIITRNLELARAQYIMAHIGFGRALLDFSDTAGEPCTVDASVGAGNLDIYLPNKKVPVIIHVKDSPLCGMHLVDGFEEVEHNVFVNMTYQANAENLMTFNIDVAMGSVEFHYVK